MDVLIRSVLLALVVFTTSGCKLGYLLRSATHQASLLRKREPIDKALNNSLLSEDDKRKLHLIEKARDFAETELGLKHTKNYQTFVLLEHPYVSYVVNAAPKNKLEHFLWRYPIVGNLPYKGFPTPEEAKQEAGALQKDGLDTFVRGVSAYSTLGWFKDPIFSSMLRYPDHDLVNTIIHETVHATVFIKSQADFNERLAVFIGNLGTELFYKKYEGEQSPTLSKIKDENHDQKLFSEFITKELSELSNWYTAHPSFAEDERAKRFDQIKQNFKTELAPKLKSTEYSRFTQAEFNNAFLMNYQLYEQDLSDFEKIYDKLERNFTKLLDYCKSLEGSDDPASQLKSDIK